jgi:hypothetical protein
MSNSIVVAFVNDDLTIKFDNIVQTKQALLEHKGKYIRVQFSKLRKNRSAEQNRYYWGVVIRMIGEYCGYFTTEELQSLHEEIKKKILPTKGRFNIPESTAKMSTDDFSNYVEKVKIFAAKELNLYIPEPNEIN